MKTRYGFISILGIVAIIILITTWSSCRCRKKGCSKYHKEGLENAEEPNNEEEEKKEEEKPKPHKLEEGMKYKRQKESFENFYDMREGITNKTCSNCVHIPYNRRHNEHWNCDRCTTKTESFDNMSNFNNIQFSNPISTDKMLDFFKDILFSTDCCPS